MGTIVKPNQAAWKQNLFSPWCPWPQPSPIHTHKHQAPQAWPTQKLDPTVTTMPNTTFSIPMWLLLMYLNGVTVVETILNISEKNTCPKRHTTSKPSYDGEMLMRVKENNSTTTTMVDMPLKHPNTLHPSKCQATPLDDRSTYMLAFFLKGCMYVVYCLPTQYLRIIISNKFSNSTKK